MVDLVAKSEGKEITADEHPVVVMNFFGRIELNIGDPDMVYDLFAAKNN